MNHFFLLGAFGEYVREELKKLKLKDARVYTYSENSRNSTDKPYLAHDCFYIKERGYDPELLKIGREDTVFCVSWTKNFFHKTPRDFPVYHIHPSLLPAFRGRGAVSAQFYAGVSVSGVSIYRDSGVPDAGDIVYREKIRIEHTDYPEDFLRKCAKTAVRGAEAVLSGKGFKPPEKQEEERASYAVKLLPEARIVDFHLSAISFYNAVRARSRPFSGSIVYLNGEAHTVWRCEVESWSGILGEPGEVVEEHEHGMEYACGEGSVIILQGQALIKN